jgi:hypothetical protein
MTNPNDPIYPRKRTQNEISALYQQMATSAQQGSHLSGGIQSSLPQSFVDDVIGGLTKREYFAAMAIQGIIGQAKLKIDATSEEIAFLAVCDADALIKELSK